MITQPAPSVVPNTGPTVSMNADIGNPTAGKIAIATKKIPGPAFCKPAIAASIASNHPTFVATKTNPAINTTAPAANARWYFVQRR